MIVFTDLESIDVDENTVVALGNFDGVHLGHQALIEWAVKTAKSLNMKSAVFTFANHPKNVIGRKEMVRNILYFEEKAEIIRRLGVDYLFNIPFDGNIRKLSATQFIDEILLGKFKMKQAYCGFNYRFGYKAEGTPEVLIHEGIAKGFGIHVLEPFKIDDNIVSSTFIRKLIATGKVDLCERYMGRSYTVGGEVVVGNRLGRTIGFPTSNLIIDETMVTPPNGVYVTNCIYSGEVYHSITNVGVKPTVADGTVKNIETHIFDFNKELYGKNIKVEFLKLMREEIKFESVEALAEQIKSDCEAARDYHENKL